MSIDNLPHLPKLPAGARMSDGDVEFHSDLLYMRGLLDDIDKHGGPLPLPWDWVDTFVPSLWPVDQAAEQLAVWRSESNSAALSVAVLTAVAYTNPERPE